MSNKTAIVILICVCVATGFMASLWQSDNAVYGRGFDQMATVILTTQALLDIVKGNYNNYFPKGYREVQRHPPLAFYSGALMLLLCGNSFAVMSMTNVIFFTILIFSLYVLAYRRGGAGVGLIAVAFILSGTVFIKYLLTWNTDMAGAAFVALTMAILDDPKTINSYWRMVLLGLVAFLGIMSRLTFWLFMGAPFLFMFLSHLNRERNSGKKAFLRALGKWLVFYFTITVLTDLLPAEYSLVRELEMEMGLVGVKYKAFHTLHNLPFYLSWWKEVGPALLIFGTMGIAIMSIKNREKLWLPLLWLLVPMVGFSYFSVNATRLLLPSWAPLALFAATPFTLIKNRKQGIIAVVGLAMALIIFFMVTLDPLFTKPPEHGAGWQEYDAGDMEIARLIRDVEGGIILLDTSEKRVFAHFMLSTRIVLDDPSRAFYRFSLEEYFELQTETTKEIKNNLDEIEIIIIREPAENRMIWDKNFWWNFWTVYRKGGINKKRVLLRTMVIEQIIDLVKKSEKLFFSNYNYGDESFRITVYKVK